MMNKWIAKLKDYWWIVLICLLILYVIVVSVLNLPSLNRITRDTFEYLKLLVPPLGIILGLILGYPLLKRKLVDGYITRQFEIMHENNRLLKKECLRLRYKYSILSSQTLLTREHIEEAVADMRKLNEMAIDATPEAFQYTQLLYNTLLEFNQRIPQEMDVSQATNEFYFLDTLSTFIIEHIYEVYKYSKSIGFIPNVNNIVKKPIVIKELNKLVTNNARYEIENLNTSLNYKHASAMLVNFYEINMTVFGLNNVLLLECCYSSIPTPGPLARILFNRKLYIPLVLKLKDKNYFDLELVLIMFHENEIINTDNGTRRYEIEGIYANLTDFGFVETKIKDENSLNNFKDTYLEDSTFDFSKVTIVSKRNERIKFKLEVNVAQEYFFNNERKIRKRLEKEL